MKVLVLGGAGLQGKAVLHDLSRSPQVREIVCADSNPNNILAFKDFLDMSKISLVEIDAGDSQALISLMKQEVDVTIDMLPVKFIKIVAEAAIEAGVNLVNTMYAHSLPEDIHARALEKGITIMPESGLDPGIDLVLCGFGVSQMDEVYELHSYCGGIPESEAADNALKYKISWTWDGVLQSYKRPAKLIRDGKIIDIPAIDQHAAENIEPIDFPGVGELELIPNGNAVIFAKLLGIEDTVKYTTRRTMRWPGHAALWKPLVDLGFLSDEPVPNLDFKLTPFDFMKNHLEPMLKYQRHEKDLVVMRNIISGKKSGKKIKITYDLLDARDTETGLLAMNRTVGYTASIVAQMLVNGDIAGKGLLTPVKDIPYSAFLKEISKRGIRVTEKVEIEAEIDPR